jgi:hypothetical protein
MPKIVHNEHECFIYGSGEDATLKEKTITANGTYHATSDDADGYSQVTVNVNQATEEKSVTSNGTYTPSSGKIGFSKVTVNVNQATETKSITSNGTYKPSSGKIGFSSVTVNVNQATEQKSITSNGTYTPSSGKIGFSKVTVNVPTASRVTVWSGSSTGNISVNLSGYSWVYVTLKTDADYPEQPQGSCMLPVGGGARAAGIMGRTYGWGLVNCYSISLTATTSGITRGDIAPDAHASDYIITSVVGIKNLS